MKKIKVMQTSVVKISTTGTNVSEAAKLVQEASLNKLRILEAAISVERQLNTVIAHYFFVGLNRKKEFEALVLDSDWCSFSAKRKLVNYIINDAGLLEGKDKEDFDKLLREVMSVRNACAHGTLSTNGTKVWLNYFECGPRQKELSDDFLNQTEAMLEKAINQALNLTIKIGATEYRGIVPQT